MSILTQDLARRLDSKLAHRAADLIVENETLRVRLAAALWLVDSFTQWVECHGCREAFVAHLVAQEAGDA